MCKHASRAVIAACASRARCLIYLQVLLLVFLAERAMLACAQRTRLTVDATCGTPSVAQLMLSTGEACSIK